MNLYAVRSFALVAVIALFFCWPLVASAQNGGFDLLQTAPGTKVDLTKMKLGIIPLKGVAFDPCIGGTDTIMERTEQIPPAGGKVPMHVYALFLRSLHHVTFQGKPADLYVTINDSNGKIPESILPQPDKLPASPGTLTVRPNHTFDSDLEVNADLIFVKANGSATTAAEVLHHEPAPTITLRSVNSPWSSKPFARYPDCPKYPANSFYPKPHHRGPHPVTPTTVSRQPQETRKE